MGGPNKSGHAAYLMTYELCKRVNYEHLDTKEKYNDH